MKMNMKQKYYNEFFHVEKVSHIRDQTVDVSTGRQWVEATTFFVTRHILGVLCTGVKL